MKLPVAGRPWVVASLSDPKRLISHALRAQKGGANLLEVRADCFPASLLKPEPLRQLLRSLRAAVRRPILLTLRSRAEGGKLHRSIDEQDRLSLVRAGFSEVDMVDVELSSEDLADHVVDEARKRRRRVILSFHDFKKTPSHRALEGLAGKFRRLKGDVLKVAALATTAAESDRLKKFFTEVVDRKAVRRTVAVAMGVHGISSRTDPASWGSCLTYGYVGRPAAPGQLSVRRLRRFLDAGKKNAS